MRVDELLEVLMEVVEEELMGVDEMLEVVEEELMEVLMEVVVLL
jgi:hypothetical protein